ncbi:hypothetical protein GGH16_000368 [Coemansia sp. RSA 560]|nr:hypothetical protein GGH16_000368 [Coemansia sp. RSA 560]
MSDDITTIFVVGFPEDMREREFQNMFTFSAGFEAATLKIPSSEDDRDAQKKQIVTIVGSPEREAACVGAAKGV